MSTGHILLLGLIAGATIFIGLPMGRLHDVGQSFKAFLSATATGILLFLFWDVLTESIEPVEDALNARDWGSSAAMRRSRSVALRSACSASSTTTRG
jgi:ZIP family zinc transporter